MPDTSESCLQMASEITQDQIKWFQSKENSGLSAIDQKIRILSQYVKNTFKTLDSRKLQENDIKLLLVSFEITFDKEIKKILNKIGPQHLNLNDTNSLNTIQESLNRYKKIKNRVTKSPQTKILEKVLENDSLKSIFASFVFTPQKELFFSLNDKLHKPKASRIKTKISIIKPSTLWIRVQVYFWLKEVKHMKLLDFEQDDLKYIQEDPKTQISILAQLITNKEFLSNFKKQFGPSYQLMHSCLNQTEKGLNKALCLVVKRFMLSSSCAWTSSTKITTTLSDAELIFFDAEPVSDFFKEHTDLLAELTFWIKDPTFSDLFQFQKSKSPYLQHLAQLCLQTIANHSKYSLFKEVSVENRFLKSGILSDNEILAFSFEKSDPVILSKTHAYYQYLDQLNQKILNIQEKFSLFKSFQDKFESIQQVIHQKSLLGIMFDGQMTRLKLPKDVSPSIEELKKVKDEHLRHLGPSFFKNLDYLFAGVLINDKSSQSLFDELNKTYFRKEENLFFLQRFDLICSCEDYSVPKGVDTLPSELLYEVVYSGSFEIACLIAKNYRGNPKTENYPAQLFEDLSKHLSQVDCEFQDKQSKINSVIDFFVILVQSDIGVPKNPLLLDELSSILEKIKNLALAFSLDHRTQEVTNCQTKISEFQMLSESFNTEHAYPKNLTLEKNLKEIFILQEDQKCYEELQQLLGENLNSKYTDGERKLSEGRKASYSKMDDKMALKTHLFDSLDAQELAERLEKIFIKLYLKIHPSEFEMTGWQKFHAPHLNAPNLNRYLKYLQMVCEHLRINLILHSADTKMTNKFVQKIYYIAKLLYARGAHDLVLHILGSLDSFAINNLELHYPEEVEVFRQEISKKYSQDRNFKSYNQLQVKRLPISQSLLSQAAHVYEEQNPENEINLKMLKDMEKIKQQHLEIKQFIIKNPASKFGGEDLELEHELLSVEYICPATTILGQNKIPYANDNKRKVSDLLNNYLEDKSEDLTGNGKA